MASIDRAGELISLVRQNVSRRLSVKLRIGFKDDVEYLVNFCRRLEAEGVEMITLHPRLVTEKFKRLARWDYVEALQKELKIPVVGNGDILTADELVKRAKNCDVMIGRGAVRHPWIFAEARDFERTSHGGTAAQRNFNIEDVGVRFLEFLTKYQPPEFHHSRAMRFFGFFCDNLKFGNYLKTQLNRAETLADIEHIWRGYFIANDE